jgi:phosphoribosylaminoimidazolecarboxamide formyltransferase / IMP cyclohydrolase
VAAVPAREPFPAVYNLQLTKTQDMRYGENPHQSAAFYRDAAARRAAGGWTQLQGKALSYNNIADADAAWECVKTFDAPAACVIVKHANPCGVAVGATAWSRPTTRPGQTDPTSAFGGILAFNRPLDEATARRIGDNKQFVEVLIAPAGHAGARACSPPSRTCGCSSAAGRGAPMRWTSSAWAAACCCRRPTPRTWRAPSCAWSPSCAHAAQMDDLLFAWKVAKFVKSNAIVFCAGGMTLGVGAGQMSRVDSARIARIKAGNAGLSLAGSAVASDAFFPFRDGLDVVIDEGAACVIQPGGSMRDDEVIAAADERGIAMVFTGTRHFRHGWRWPRARPVFRCMCWPTRRSCPARPYPRAPT